MTKSKKAKGRKVAPSSDEETQSLASETSDMSLTREPVEEVGLEGALDGYIEDLYEKRTSTRVAALRNIVTTFTNAVCTELLETRCDTLVQLALACLKRGGEEMSYAIRLLGLLTLTVESEGEAQGIVSSASALLTRVARDASEPEVRCGACEVLSLMAFVGSQDEDATVDVMKLMEHVFAARAGKVRPVPDETKAAALRGWGLLATVIDDSAVTAAADRISSTLCSLLADESNAVVRMAAGETVAILYESLGPQTAAAAMKAGPSSRARRDYSNGAAASDVDGGDDDDDDVPEAAPVRHWSEEAQEVPMRRGAAGSPTAATNGHSRAREEAEGAEGEGEGEGEGEEVEGKAGGDGEGEAGEEDSQRGEPHKPAGKKAGGNGTKRGRHVRSDDDGEEEEEMDIPARMRELSALSDKRRSAKENGEQKAAFRDLVAIVEGRPCPETCVKLKYGDALTLTSWCRVVQLNAMRRFLLSGFQPHLQENPLLHQIFSFTPISKDAPRSGGKSYLEKRLYMSPSSSASKARTKDRARSRKSNQGAYDD
eukprot:jgi/Mesvir1/10579/Mv21794-RA.1